MLVKGVVFRFEDKLSPEAKLLLEDFRLAVNSAVRAGFRARVTSRNALTRLAYKDFRQEHPQMYAQHLVSAFEVAAALLKSHRKRVRRGNQASVPFIRRLFMKAENQAYKLDRENGVIDLPIMAGCHVRLKLVLADYNRGFLDDHSYSLGSLTLTSDRAVIAFEREAPKPYAPDSALSLDTNERSLDGVFIRGDNASVVKADFPDVATIQKRHHDRRKRLRKKKAHDRRTSRRLCRKEGAREHHRIEYRLHEVANAVLSFAENQKSAIVLEDLKGFKSARNKGLNRRLSLWPRRELHRIIEYKAQWKGIPVVKVDPRYSSRTCPMCGRIQDSRMGAEFVCECGWHLNRHINASLNLLQTAISKGLEVAGGLRFNPGAFQHDVMMILYDPERGARSEPNGTSCVTVASGLSPPEMQQNPLITWLGEGAGRPHPA
jgi:putative transposase